MLLDRLELGRVKVLVEVGAAGVGETVEACGLSNEFDHAACPQLWQSVLGSARGWTADILHSLGCQVPVIAECLKDRVVGRFHPLRALSHIVCVEGDAHNGLSYHHLRRLVTCIWGHGLLMGNDATQILSDGRV